MQVCNEFFKIAKHLHLWLQTHASICFETEHIILGVAIDDPNDEGIILIKKKGKVKMLQDEIESREKDLNFEKVNCNYTNIYIVSYK